MSDPVTISVFVLVTTCCCCVEFALAAVERYYNLVVTFDLYYVPVRLLYLYMYHSVYSKRRCNVN